MILDSNTRALLLLLTLGTLGCNPAAPHSESPVSEQKCKALCDHLDKLRCDVRSPEGRDCEESLCQIPGVKVECLLGATSCEEANRMQVRGCSK